MFLCVSELLHQEHHCEAPLIEGGLRYDRQLHSVDQMLGHKVAWYNWFYHQLSRSPLSVDTKQDTCSFLPWPSLFLLLMLSLDDPKALVTLTYECLNPQCAPLTRITLQNLTCIMEFPPRYLDLKRAHCFFTSQSVSSGFCFAWHMLDWNDGSLVPPPFWWESQSNLCKKGRKANTIFVRIAKALTLLKTTIQSCWSLTSMELRSSQSSWHHLNQEGQTV